MDAALRLLLHHSESVNPTLVHWLRDKIDEVLGLGPATIVAVLGIVMVAFPVTLLALARRRRRGAIR